MPRSVLAASGCRHRPWNAVSLEDHMAPYTRYGEQPRRSRRDRPIVVRAPSPGSHGCGGGFRTPSKSQCDRSGSQAVDSSVKLCWICYPEPCLRPMSVPCGRENAGCVLHCQWDWCLRGESHVQLGGLDVTGDGAVMALGQTARASAPVQGRRCILIRHEVLHNTCP